MLRAILFDFNGVIVDDEPLHYRMFQRLFDEERVPFDEETYYARYLPMDDRALVRAVHRDLGRAIDPAGVEALVARKARDYREAMLRGVPLFDGVREFVRRAAANFPLAIASGAARVEIEHILQEAGLRECFLAVVAAEDVARGKPDPECFRRALAAINAARRGTGAEIRAEETLVIEDSPAGIEGAHAAGMRCLAVANSVTAERLSAADSVVRTLVGIDPGTLAG